MSTLFLQTRRNEFNVHPELLWTQASVGSGLPRLYPLKRFLYIPGENDPPVFSTPRRGLSQQQTRTSRASRPGRGCEAWPGTVSGVLQAGVWLRVTRLPFPTSRALSPDSGGTRHPQGGQLPSIATRERLPHSPKIRK